jgi:uncharacterized membrane protein
VSELDKNEYLRKLDKKLKRLPPDERANAIAYYAEYFDEAGIANFAYAMDNLGSPSVVAAGILAEYTYQEVREKRPRIKRGISAVWFAIIGVLALPIGIPLAIAILAVAFAIIVSLGAVFFSLFATATVVTASGLACIIVGAIILPSSLAAGALYIGGGFICISLGILLGYGTYKLLWLSIRGLIYLFTKMRYRRILKKGTTGTYPEPQERSQANAQQ